MGNTLKEIIEEIELSLEIEEMNDLSEDLGFSDVDLFDL